MLELSQISTSVRGQHSQLVRKLMPRAWSPDSSMGHVLGNVEDFWGCRTEFISTFIVAHGEQPVRAM